MNPEIEEHLRIAEDRYRAAELLVKNAMNEDAIARIYYAMFHATTAILLHHDIQRSSHQALISAFGQHLVKTGILPRGFQRLLQDAFDSRMDADYGTHMAFSAKTAQEHLVSAREFIDVCRQHIMSEQKDE